MNSFLYTHIIDVHELMVIPTLINERAIQEHPTCMYVCMYDIYMCVCVCVTYV